MTTETQTVPEKHSSVVGGSTAARRLHCTASYKLEQMVPKDKGSVYAHEGTALHEIMAKMLLDPELGVYSILPFTFKHAEGWEYTIDESCWEEKGQVAIDGFLDFMDNVEQELGGEFEYIIEKSCEMPGIAGAFGTSDVIWKCGDVSGVWDWKFGRGAVSAEENDQLRFYARAAMNTHPEMFPANPEGPREVWLSIMQPMLSDKDDTWITDTDELEEWRVGLVKAVAEAQGLDGTPVKGKWCDFAECKAVCPLHVNPAVLLAQKLAAIKDAEDDREETSTNTPEFIEALPALLELAEIAKDWAKELFARAQYIAMNDEEALGKLEDRGWGLKPGRVGNLAYDLEDKKIISRAGSRGLKIDDVAPRQLITPTKMKAALKKLGKEMPEDWASNPPPSGPTFARLYEDTEKWETHSAKTKALGEKLAHLRGQTEE